MKVSDLSWITGFWEGEGSAGFHKRSTAGRSLRVCITQTRRQPVKLVHSLLGYGRLYRQKATPIGGRIGRKYIYRWQCTDRNARLFMNQILPYCRMDHKRNQLKFALQRDRRQSASHQ